MALRAAWSWERTHVVVTTEKLYVAYGFFRRRAAGVRLARARTIEVEQSLLGRLLRYGTLIAGDLEVDYVADPWRVWEVAGGVDGGDAPVHRPLARAVARRAQPAAGAARRHG